jgi:EAL domain-containing protein (putative c-di-GMP-specific phosphodiesterase class I)
LLGSLRLNAQPLDADAGGMSEVDDRLGFTVPPAAEAALSTIGESLPEVVRRFATHGALGVIAVDASVFLDIEREFGGAARLGAMLSLRAVVEQSIGDRLGIGDLILSGEIGRNEVLILLFREIKEKDFYNREIPDLHACLAQGLKARGARIGYPYLTASPRLPVGTAASLRNPTIAAESQIRNALDQARNDASLNESIGARRRRQKIFELVIGGHVRSVYEPIVGVETRTVFGYEALARGPEGSELHSPSALFKSACEDDLLFQLDCLCRQSGLDGARDFPGESKLFLNIRPTTIYDPSFRSDALRRTLESCGLSPKDVVLEISEQESISNFEIFREIRDYYGNLGFEIAMDDVGSGYASLEAVMELSPDYIKVDRAFVSGIDEDPIRQELLRALLSVAEPIGARIIGEGLDTLEELETLGRLGIPFGQGWLFGKPHPLRTDT